MYYTWINHHGALERFHLVQFSRCHTKIFLTWNVPDGVNRMSMDTQVHPQSCVIAHSHNMSCYLMLERNEAWWRNYMDWINLWSFIKILKYTNTSTDARSGSLVPEAFHQPHHTLFFHLQTPDPLSSFHCKTATNSLWSASSSPCSQVLTLWLSTTTPVPQPCCSLTNGMYSVLLVTRRKCLYLPRLPVGLTPR